MDTLREIVEQENLPEHSVCWQFDLSSLHIKQQAQSKTNHERHSFGIRIYLDLDPVTNQSYCSCRTDHSRRNLRFPHQLYGQRAS